MGVGVRVRLADDGDLSALTTLRRLWSEENAGAPIDDAAFDAAFAAWWEAEQSTRTFFLVELDEVVIGMANVKRYERMPVPDRSSGHWGYVGNVFVLPDHRNDGIGATLMHALQEWAWSAGMAHLRLAPSPLSATFYDRLGYLAGSVVELDPPRG